MRRKLAILGGVVLLIAIAVALFAWINYPAWEEAFQRDADIARLRHLEYYGSLIEEYRKKTGKVPLQGRSAGPILVYVANDYQEKYTSDGPEKVVPLAEFIAALEEGLGRPVDEFYDPQYAPINKPNFYMYLVDGKTFFFAIHVHQPFPFARKVSDNYYKVEISNAAKNNLRGWITGELFANTDFQNERDKRIENSLFAARDEKYRHFTKQK